MSRIIVKNLPKKITEEKLFKLFAEKGQVTDVQLKYTPEGKFRQFAFVGYQNEDDARSAISFFDKTYLTTNKITVELCSTLDETRKPGKNVQKANCNDEVEIDKGPKKKDKKRTNLLEKYKQDPLFKEFMQVHAPQEVELLENDKDENENDQNSNEPDHEGDTEDNEKIASLEISDAEYLNVLKKKTDKKDVKVHSKEQPAKDLIKLYTVKMRGLPYTCKKKDIKQFLNPLKPYTIRLPPKIKGIAYIGFKTEKQANKALLKNKSFLNGKRVFVNNYEKSEANANELHHTKNKKWHDQEKQLENEESIAESGRIFLRNLAYSTTEDDIKQLFEKHGPLTEINLPIDSVTRKMKGFGTVTFLMPEHAVKAYSELDGTILHGRMLHLLPGKAKDEPDDDAEETTNYKKKKAAKQKSQAGSSHNWNSLFLGQNAVAETIADTYNVSKEDVLAPHSDSNAAVRLALGETQIVANTKKYLEEHGVVLDAFNQTNSKRSGTLILVKNLPSKTNIKEIKQLFENYGLVGRVILPPSGITAVVEFLEPSEARKAFSKLAYSKFKNMPLYLEWAPENSLIESIEDQHKEETKLKDNESSIDKGINVEEYEEYPEEGTTLFVKNLKFETTDDSLRKHFETCGRICYAKVARKRSKSSSQDKLSMGFGFVQFYLKSDADKALKSLQQTFLDGKSLELKRSERTLKGEVKSGRQLAKRTKQTGTKILVRNVPFQATKKELTEIFKAFGEIRALRLPNKIALGSESHRGFAFVDYVSESDAKTAFESLCQSTHLYGRRLVLEWATTGEDINEMRKRTAEHFTQATKVKSKKSTFNIE